MKLKTMLAFLAGGLIFMWFEAMGCADKTNYPREGSIVYEDDKIKVTRMSKEKSKKIDLATVTYKEQTEKKAEEA